METTTCIDSHGYRLDHKAKESNGQIGHPRGRFKVRNSGDAGASILVKVTGPAKLRLNSSNEDDVGGEGGVKLIGDVIIRPCSSSDTPLVFLMPHQQHLIYIDHEGGVVLDNVQQLAQDPGFQEESVGNKNTMKVGDPNMPQEGDKKTHKRNISEGFIVVTGDNVGATTTNTDSLKIRNCGDTGEDIKTLENCVTAATNVGTNCLKSELLPTSGDNTPKQSDILAEDCVDSVIDFSQSNTCYTSGKSGSSSLLLIPERSDSECSDSNNILNINNLNHSVNGRVRDDTNAYAANDLPINIKNELDESPQRVRPAKETVTCRGRGANEYTDSVLLKDPIRDSFTHLLNCIYLMDLCDHLYQNCIVDMELYQKLFDMSDTSLNERNAKRHLLLYLSKRKVNKQKLKKALNDSENYTLVSSFFPEDNL